MGLDAEEQAVVLTKSEAQLRGLGPALVLAWAAVFGVLLPEVPAGAAVIFSISGTVGDSNWNGNELIRYFGSDYFQHDGYFQQDDTPGGTLLITYTGPAFTGMGFSSPSGNQLFSRDDTAIYRCPLPEGCTDPSQLAAAGGDESFGHGYVFPGFDGISYFWTFDNRYHVDPLIIPAYGAFFAQGASGYVSFTLDQVVDSAAIGQPFTLTASIIPEPAIWMLLLFGFGGIGRTLRRNRRAILAQEEDSPCSNI